MNDFNLIQTIKRRFFAFRNGVVADALRKNGSQFKIIFGLNLPQIKEIATDIGYNHDAARLLWGNTSTRESMILAPMLINPAELTIEEACSMVESVPEVEIADMLCHSLLRKMPKAIEIIRRYAEADNELLRYVAMQLLWPQIGKNNVLVKQIAVRELESTSPLTHGLARRLLDELEFIS